MKSSLRISSALILAATLAATLGGCGGGPAEAAPEVGDVVATASEALARNALTPAQAKTVLSLADEICGDTWCDGDYDFGFRRIVCDAGAGTCTLTVQIFPRDGVPSSQRSYFRACKTHGFTGFDSLVSGASGGYQALADGYYEALTECTSRIVAKLSG